MPKPFLALAAGVIALAGLGVSLLPADTAHASAASLAKTEPVLLELFTSQGCSSCPPADQLAEKLAADPGLVVISRPVTYWDRLGWKDSLAREDNTALQQVYAAAGLKGKIALYGSGFLTEGVLQAAGPAADGVMTTLHYSDSLDTPRNKKFRLEYAKTFKMQPDVYAVQGYDTGLLLIQGANAVNGDLSKKPDLYKAMQGAVIDSPRGKWTMSKTHNPIQDMYLRVVENGENKVIGVAAKALADPGTGCKMG
jgi:hypothetical protein